MLKGKIAVVTGGSRGIGGAIAKKLAEQGADVAIIYHSGAEKAEAVRSEITAAYGVTCRTYSCDVADGAACKATADAILADFGGVDILVNNAGITRDGLLVTMEDADFDAVVDTNLGGAFHMTKAFGRNFIRRKSGKIINIASVSGTEGVAGQANYAAAKAGVIALTKVTAREFAGKNVCCNAIAPGFIRTDMTKEMEEDPRIATIPLKRMGEAEEVAHLAAFLASPAADYITGEVIKIDGGLTM
ncbi:MAG: glucose 1-dehydrogenase [Ruminococcaceae bacterium]|nr:glucose 1-dehydrogenase [Oscillospiraceae bacterium]